MTSSSELRNKFNCLKQEATLLAGQLTDLKQRATVYHHLFHDSGNNHCFPLIAAHGALWAGAYFRRGLQLGRVLSLQYGFASQKRAAQLEALDEFADAFRDVNRRVCIDTYTNFHFVDRYGHMPGADALVPRELLSCLRLLSDAKRQNRTLTDIEREQVFVTHFLHEQEHVVGPSLETAVQELDWPLIKAIALKPIVKFAYFPKTFRLWFNNFANQQERIQNGLHAYRTGASVGWSTVESALDKYDVLPQAVFDSPRQHFEGLRAAIVG